MEYIRVNQFSGFLPVQRQFACAHCGREVVVNTAKDKRIKYCSAQCEKQYWRDRTKGKRCTNLRTLSEGEMKRKLQKEKWQSAQW